MKILRIFLIAANSAAIAVLLAIPIGKMIGVIEEQVDAAAVFGWLIFFVPLLASALALCGMQFYLPSMTRTFVIIAMPGSFLMAFLSLYIFWQGPGDFVWIGLGAAILLGSNVLALWEQFKALLEAPTSKSIDSDEDI